jgi:hypothetical protein
MPFKFDEIKDGSHQAKEGSTKGSKLFGRTRFELRAEGACHERGNHSERRSGGTNQKPHDEINHKTDGNVASKVFIGKGRTQNR